MEKKLPWMNAYGNITKTLEKIRTAATPSRFTQDFLATKLGLEGGSPKAVIPFLKRTGFLGSDGAPTELYMRFRNPSESGKAATIALRKGYASLYEMNEYVHDLPDKNLKGLIVQATGSKATSSTVKGTVGSFKALKAFATFDEAEIEETIDENKATPPPKAIKKADTQAGINLSYTINLNLPATSDIAVFDAIFKSLREHLLGGDQ